MADNAIKISEVSEMLRMQLKGIDTRVQFNETGVVVSVSDGVIRIFGLRNAEANELLEFDNGMQAIVMNLEEDNVGAILLGASSEIKEGFTVNRTGRVASIYVGEGMFDVHHPSVSQWRTGSPRRRLKMPLERKAPGVVFRQPVDTPLQTGLKAGCHDPDCRGHGN